MSESVYHEQEGDSKKCAMCGKTKSKKEFHKMSSSPDSLRPSCKTCRKEREKNPVIKPDPSTVTSKKCTKCDLEKSLEEFDNDSDGKYGKVSHCKECRAKHNRQFRQDHLDKFQAYDRNRSGDPKRNENWRRRYQERYSQDPKYMAVKRASIRRWNKNNPLKGRERLQRRKAWILENTVGEVSYDRILERDGLFCYLCQQKIEDLSQLEFDHVIPLSRGGEHSEANIRPTHEICNQRKNDRLLEELSEFDRRGP